jgi:hypothetical protein
MGRVGRPAIYDRKEMRKNQIVVPLNETEKQLIVDAAQKADLSMSAYVRMVLREHFDSRRRR